jgi:hypothetical protein
MDEKFSTDPTQATRIPWQAPQLTEIDIEGATLVVAGSGPDGGGSSSHS